MTKTLLTTAFVLTLNACDTATQTHAPQATTDVDPVTVALVGPAPVSIDVLQAVPQGSVYIREGWKQLPGELRPCPAYLSTWRVQWTHIDGADLYTLDVNGELVTVVPDGSLSYVYEEVRYVPKDDFQPLTDPEILGASWLDITLSTNGGEPVTVVWGVL